MSWRDLLADYIRKGKQKSPEDQEKEACDIFLNILEDDNQSKLVIADKTIPRFFYKKPINYNTLYFNIKQEAKTRFLSVKSMEIPEKKSKLILNQDLKELWLHLKEHISEPKEENIERINYQDFKKVANLIGSSFSSFFTATTFLKFDKDKYGRIDIVSFFHYVVKKTNIEQNKISLLVSDSYGEGFLTDKDLESYIKDEIRQFFFYDEISEDIKEYYLLVAQRKFFFFLDPKRTGKIYIKDIIVSRKT